MASPSIKTTCKDCVFAIFENFQPDPTEAGILTQTGCRLGRLKKFQEIGVPTHVEDTEDGRTAYVIEGRICMAARKSGWGETLSPAQQEAKVREELRFACHVYVVALQATPNEIEETLESLVVQSPLPKVAEVLVQGRTRPGPLIVRLNEKFGGRINWKLTVINAEETTKDQAIDSAVNRCRNAFYAIFNAGSVAQSDFMAKLDRAVNEELRSFAVVSGDADGNGLVVVTQMHNHLGGNEPVDMVNGDPLEMTEEELENAPRTEVVGILNKVRFLTEKCGSNGLILKMEELCQK